MAKRKSAKIPAKKADDNPTAKATPPRDNIEQLESLPLVLTADLPPALKKIYDTLGFSVKEISETDIEEDLA